MEFKEEYKAADLCRKWPCIGFQKNRNFYSIVKLFDHFFIISKELRSWVPLYIHGVNKTFKFKLEILSYCPISSVVLKVANHTFVEFLSFAITLMSLARLTRVDFSGILFSTDIVLWKFEFYPTTKLRILIHQLIILAWSLYITSIMFPTREPTRYMWSTTIADICMTLTAVVVMVLYRSAIQQTRAICLNC